MKRNTCGRVVQALQLTLVTSSFVGPHMRNHETLRGMTNRRNTHVLDHNECHDRENCRHRKRGPASSTQAANVVCRGMYA